jgi:beta-glucosidase-like glycosyl hydrolase/CubicO group peptidase (beta-lactamase class C family)
MKLHRIAAICLALTTACASARSPVPPSDSDRSWAREALSALTLEEKVGQLIYPRANGLFVSEAEPGFRALLEAAREGRIGGLVFFKGDPFETAAIANRLQRESRLPLLVASDSEWGAAMRVEGASRFPRAMVLGASGSKDDAELAAEVTAREARALGVHLLLNPVLDLNTNPENPVIDTRSFGESPEGVARLGAAYIRRAQASGVLATAKHFPGHGGTDADSHLSLPIIRDDRERLARESLVPFRAAIDEGVAAVMTAHVAVPALDGQERRPATLSPEILEELLRGELGFRGLVVSDALDMGGAREGAWDGEVAVSALRAGVDMLLVPPDPLVTHRAVVRAVRRGDLSEARLDRSVLRILEAKEALGLDRRRTVDLMELPRRLARPAVSERIDEMAGRGVTAITNRGGVLPFPSEAPPEILLVDFVEDHDPDVEPEVLAKELERRTRIREIEAAPRDDARVAEEIESMDPEVLLLASYLRSRSALGRAQLPPRTIEVVKNRIAAGGTVVFAGLGSPYLLTALPGATALVATYDFAPASQRALARALFGEIDVEARLPVTLSPEYPLGQGVSIPRRRMTLEVAKSPEEAGFSKDRLGEAAEVVEAGIEAGTAPGAVALVARRGEIVLERAFGRLSYDDDAAPATRETLYDIASLTKVVVTTTLAMILYERGLLDLDARITSYVPEFHGGEKDLVSVRDLLAHSGGLLWWTDLYKRFEGKSPPEARLGYLETIYSLPLDYSPRTKMVYSDLGILLLGEILERITGRDLESLARAEILEPLGMDDTMFRPDPSLLPRIAPTERDPWRGRVVRGEVHDENAYGLGGVAPHAGLFSTARSLARFAQMMINGGAYNGRRLLNPATIALFTGRANLVGGSSRALGWDTPSETSSAGRFFSARSYGHTGFTGTSLWIDPERELFVILLTNRVHPTRENQKIAELRPAFHDAVEKAIEDVEILPRPPQ